MSEMCRKCGSLLEEYSYCVRCKQTMQQICSVCKRLTEIQYHEYCTYQLAILKMFPIPPEKNMKQKLMLIPVMKYV